MLFKKTRSIPIILLLVSMPLLAFAIRCPDLSLPDVTKDWHVYREYGGSMEDVRIKDLKLYHVYWNTGIIRCWYKGPDKTGKLVVVNAKSFDNRIPPPIGKSWIHISNGAYECPAKTSICEF